MGGRGATSSISRSSKSTILKNVQTLMGNNPSANLQSNVNTNNTNQQSVPVVKGAVNTLTQMSDDQLAQLFNASKNVDMPNHLNDRTDATQKFVYAIGLNEKPQVLDTTQFNKYLKDNNIPKSDILARTTGSANYTVNGTPIKMSPDLTLAMIKDGALNYIGGKQGGQAYGAGTYFDKNGGKPTGYASGRNNATMLAVLSPNAKPISLSDLQTQTSTWVKSHPKFNNAVGGFSSRNASIYALAQGYNVITDSRHNPSYHNVIDRSALVVRKENY